MELFWHALACNGSGWRTTLPRDWSHLSFLPAVGQGALGLECRRDDTAVETLVKPLNDDSTYRAVLAERAVLATLQGGCTLPIAAWARDLEQFERRAGRPNARNRCRRVRSRWQSTRCRLASRLTSGAGSSGASSCSGPD